jgi:extracellular factor (EF) 3-hydroxypalmitic acid methyl ester biosynthesis protein
MASPPPARSNMLPPPSLFPSRPASSPPPRGDSVPPSGRRPISTPPPRHEDLDGARGAAVRFRPARLNAAELSAHLECRFRCDSALVGPLALVDLSTSGFAATAPPELALAPGSVLEQFQLLVDGHPIWSGDAVVVHGSPERIGARFTSGVLDLHHLRLGATMDGRLAIHREQRERLPAEWRAAVADVRQLLEDARLEMDDLERSETHDPMRRADGEAQLFEALRARWGSAYYESLARLHEMSKGLDERATALGKGYAASMLMPLLGACSMHRRAYEKPLGYAGDYRLMELYFTREFAGEGLFGRFLHSIAQHYTLGRTVVAREVIMRDAVRAALDAEGEGPVRILALAAGPAIELRRLLRETRELRRPLELILLDQEPAAHESAHRELTRVLLEHHRGMLPVSVKCVHSSVRQLLKPQTPEDHAVLHDTLANVDLIYSAGLYDYLPQPVAASLTRLLYSKLCPSGRLLLGNLKETPDTTWIMDYVLGWTLLYRTEETLLSLAIGLSPLPSSAGITADDTRQCIFLDIRRSDSA